MYTRFFNLKEKPFNLTPDPKYLYLSNNHKEIYAQLLYSVKEEVGFVVLIGEIGTGKTTLCRAFLNQLPEKYVPAFIFNPNLDDLELYKSLNKELGVAHRYTSKKVLQDALNNYLLRQKRAGKQVLLIIDEAQNLSQAVLEQIRLLSNLETETQKLIQIILVGQPELGTVLEGHSLRQLNQRVSVRCHLYPLSYRDSIDYISHRLKMSGGIYRDIFTRAALFFIYRFSKGTPRLINILCDRALLAAYSSNSRKVTAPIIRKCIKEINGAGNFRKWMSRMMPAFAVGAVVALIFYIGTIFGGIGMPARSGSIMDRLRNIVSVSLTAKPAIAEAEEQAQYGDATGKSVEAGTEYEEEEITDDSVALAQPLEEASAQPEQTAVTADYEEAVTDTADANMQVVAAVETAPAVIPVERTEAIPMSPDGIQESLVKDAFSGSGRREAINAVFDVWKVANRVGRNESELTFWRIAVRRNLNCFAENMDMEMLRAINYPVVLEVVDENGRTGFLPVVRIWGKKFFADSNADRFVEKEWVTSHWNGKAYIFWKDFRKLPQIMKKGDQNISIKWLQESLKVLGYTNVRPVGAFGRKTEKSVMRFQLDNRINADGQVGELTKMFLYNILPQYETPKLT